MAKKPAQHYVDNAKFFKDLKAYRVACMAADKKKRDRPRMSEYLGECFLKIATHLSYKPNFVNYTFRDDMISDGIENCLVYVHNFDFNKSTLNAKEKVKLDEVASIIKEINPTYKYPSMLITTVVEGAHQQRFFAEHLPRLTNKQPKPHYLIKFYMDLVLKTIKTN